MSNDTSTRSSLHAMPSEVTGGRVCITCDFDVGRSLKRIELPFVVGVLADLSGQRNEPLRHAPFVAAASPNMFSMDRFDEVARVRDLAKIFEAIAYVRWTSFRKSDNAAYVALTLPRVLARQPYGTKLKRISEFNFEEITDGDNQDDFLWMSAAWAYAACVTAAFAKHGWFARTPEHTGVGVSVVQ